MNRPILIQGAMKIEIDYLISKLENMKVVLIDNYEFYTGKINNYPVVVSRTEIGIINATMATILGIDSFNPLFVINQGIAGSHRENIHVDDIVIGKGCVNINVLETNSKIEGQGITAENWEIKPTRLINNQKRVVLDSDENLLNIFSKEINAEENKKIYIGIIGSGDIFNREIDRIKLISKQFDTLCEDMETASTYTVCYRKNVPVLGVRAISNNEITNEEFVEEKTAQSCQEFVYINVCKYINNIKDRENI